MCLMYLLNIDHRISCKKILHIFGELSNLSLFKIVFCRVGDRRSQLPISGPSDFVHIVHMGPGAGLELQNLMDLKQLGPAAHSQSSASVGTGAADKVC